MIKEYRTYLKDNPKGYWFKAKCYGWGWTPVKWQGWVTILVFLALIWFTAHRFVTTTPYPTQSDLVDYFAQLGLLILLLLGICWKTGEKPRWQWGPPKKK